jgi:uncharacterized C2H2 Zn-finger protein
MEFENPEELEAETVDEEEVEEVEDEPIEYECPKCGKTYKRESALVKHVADCDATPEGEAPVFEPTDCPKCGKTYKTQAWFEKHVESCTGPKDKIASLFKFEPTDCPKCGKTYERQTWFEEHVESCTGPKDKVERVPMTDEEKAAKRKEYVQRWVEKNVTIQIRLLKGGDDLAFVDSRVEKLREKDENAGWATYFRGLLEADKKKAIRKGDWEKNEEA